VGTVISYTFIDVAANHSIHADFIEEASTNQPPIADFDVNVTYGVAPLNVSFDASNSYDPDGYIASYNWDFKDEATGSGETISHTFNSAGSYNVELTVTDNDGATNVSKKLIEVIEGTLAGGIISEDTTWAKENNPYIISDTVQIPSGIKLTINPGVTIKAPSSVDMFLINGEIFAHGTQTARIVFDGGNNSNFFDSKNSSIDTFLDLEYCKIMNGKSFWPPSSYSQHGAFSLKHCTLENLTYYSYIWYPQQDIYIEYNKFINTGGFSVGHDDNIKVYIRYNLFDTKNPNLPSYADYCVQNWVAYSSSQTIVKYNSFINMNGIVLKLPSGYPSTSMIATENYWGTKDTSEIDDMIYDKNDDITCANYIEYEPILTEPHPNVP
jgi:PKD repeat protein